MKKKCLFPFLLILSLMLSGCGQKAQDSLSEEPGIGGSGTEESSAPESTSVDMEADAAESSVAEGQNGETETPVVYMTTDISSDGLMRIYQALAAKLQ